MSAMLFALALFGCSDDGSVCRRIDTAPPAYQSEERCVADSEKALASMTALSAEYPSVYAQCVPARVLARLGNAPVDLTRRPFRLARQGD